MVFWISSTVISVVILIMSGMKLIRSNSQPKWPLAVVFSLAILASLGSVVLATVTSVNVRQSLQANNNEKVRPDDSFDSLVANLQKDLEKNPGRIEGWSLLGRSFVALGRLDDAISAFRQAVERSDPPAAEQIGELAETIVAAAGGRVEQEAEQLFAQVLTINPGDPRARYYLAEAHVTRGNLVEARTAFTAMLSSAPKDAPWRTTVSDRLKEISQKAQDVSEEERIPGPSSEQVADAANMPPEERAEMIRDMVDGLAEKMKNNPDDFSGWLRLANSYMVLNEQAKAAAALKSALALQPGNAGLLVQFAEVLISINGGRISEEAENALKRAFRREPGNPQASWRLGQAAAQRGDKEEARRFWSELLPKLLSADPLKAEVKRALDAL